MLNGADKCSFGTIKTNLDNNMTCGSDSYPRTKDEAVGLLNNYYVSKKLMRATPVKVEVAFIKTSSNTNTSNTNKKGESDCFRSCKPNH